MSLQEIQAFNAAQNDWTVKSVDSEMVTLNCRDTGEVATIHLEDLQSLEA